MSWGSAIAGAVWLLGSLLLSWYVANFGDYNATYGSLGGVIGFMIWLWLSTTVVLVGGEINAELEHQTARDTTEGHNKPMGRAAPGWPTKSGRHEHEVTKGPAGRVLTSTYASRPSGFGRLRKNVKASSADIVLLGTPSPGPRVNTLM